MKIEQETLGRLVGFTIESIPDPELKSIQRLAAKKSFMKIEQETLGRLVGFTIENIPDPELKSIQRLAAKNENRAGDFGEVGLVYN